MKFSVKIAGIFAVVAFALTAVSANAAFTRDLTLGSTGADVIELQTWLEMKGMLMIPAGVSKGYFGALTQSALARYQASVGISPAVGYFGPITRAKVAMDTTPVTPPANGGDDDDDSDTDNDDDLSGGEASLEQFDLSSGDDSDVEEGASAEIAKIEFDVEDGDVSIDRVDLALVADSGNEEEDPWDSFDSLRLLVDGEEIGETDLSDEDNYLDEDDGTIRISGIDHIVREGETVNIMIEITAQNSVDGADADAADWTISVDGTQGIRVTDAEGIQQYTGSASDEVDFTIEVEGDGEELNVSSSNDDPESETLEVMDDGKSDPASIFVFDLEAEESDIEIDTVLIEIETGTEDVIDVVSEFTLEIDGEEFDDWSFVDNDDGATTTATIEFDIDSDYTLDADSEVAVVLIAEFKAANGTNFATSGETIQASIETGAIDGEGADDVTSDGSATGDEHTLAIAGLTAELSSKESDTSGDNDTVGEYTFVVDITAFEEEAFVELAASRGTTTNSDVGFSVAIFDGSNALVTTGTTTFSVTADEDEDNNNFVEIGSEDTVQFTVEVFFDAATSGTYRAQLYSVNHNDQAANEDTVFQLVPESTYRSSSEYVNAQ